ncbi:MAG: hypothetical protein GTO41_08890, partial [Burkholderiales bacterium]|nr:hypothetical protein [Burkholderiales bacterium]
MGYNMITELRAQGIEFDAKQMIEGMRAAIAGKDPPMTDEEIRNVMMAFERQIVQKQQSMMKQLAEKNSREGEAFLQANAEKPGVVRTESGLQYIVLEEGTGDTPAVTDKVRVRYVGSSIDGQVFDATDAGEAREFAVGAVVRGMTEALTKMKVGSK